MLPKRNQVLKAKIAQAQAQVSEDEANLKQLEEQLSYTDIVSPIDGIVLSRDVEMGMRSAPFLSSDLRQL